MAKEEYTQIPWPSGDAYKAMRCACCGGEAEAWQYVTKDDQVQRVVMCDHSGDIGPRDSLLYEGCLLQMPPPDFYRETGRAAVRYWNEYAKALTAAQRANRWKTARVLRTTESGS